VEIKEHNGQKVPMPTPEQIKKARARLGMTQREFALALGLTGKKCWRTIQNWELGYRVAPKYLSLAIKQLCKRE
jgi:DNA-binding transcriptional regulator YiaG